MEEKNCNNCAHDGGTCPLDKYLYLTNRAERYFRRAYRREMTVLTGCVVHVKEDRSREVTITMKR